MQIKYSIIKVLWNMYRSYMESSSSSTPSSIPNRNKRNILEQSISLCSLLSSSSLTFFFNRIHFSQLSYCSLTATLRKRYTIAPKKGTPTLSGFLINNRHSLACTTHNGAQHRVYNRRGILPSTAQGKSPSRREDLSLVTHSKLYTTVVEYCPLYT